jgi:hypothetical protein
MPLAKLTETLRDLPKRPLINRPSTPHTATDSNGDKKESLSMDAENDKQHNAGRCDKKKRRCKAEICDFAVSLLDENAKLNHRCTAHTDHSPYIVSSHVRHSS